MIFNNISTIQKVKYSYSLFLFLFIISISSCTEKTNTQTLRSINNCPKDIDTFYLKLVEAAINRTKKDIIYDPSYYSIKYPNGDVDSTIGVCTDVIIRIYREAANIDLQKEVHEDMSANFSKYPTNWGLTKPDKNIDHRRVPNLMKYFERQGASLPVTHNSKDFKPGDIVCWNLGGNITHIGFVVCNKSSDNKRYLIVHNIGAGPKMEDIIFDYDIIGHYRYKK